eukprot:2591469-Alexandrium_andersonii.AAC.1
MAEALLDRLDGVRQAEVQVVLAAAAPVPAPSGPEPRRCQGGPKRKAEELGLQRVGHGTTP